jgi:hypothetical protein
MPKSKVAVGCLVVFLLLLCSVCLGVYYMFFHVRTTAHVASVSPDGMYKCEVTERGNPYGNQTAKIVLYRHWWWPDKQDWKIQDSNEIGGDSACRSNYSIDWEYNAKRRSTKVIVFGDYGSPPYEGRVVFERLLDPNAVAVP